MSYYQVGKNAGRVDPDETAASEAGEAEDAAGDAEEEGDDGEGDVRGEGEVVVHPEEEHEGEQKDEESVHLQVQTSDCPVVEMTASSPPG